MTYNVMGLYQGGVCHCHLNWKSGIKDKIMFYLYSIEQMSAQQEL